MINAILSTNSSISLTEQEAILRIKNVYHAGYSPSIGLTAWEQLEICESLVESGWKESNVNVNGNGNGIGNHIINTEINQSNQAIIAKLKLTTYRTPVFKIAELLENLFLEYKADQGHWTYIAENFPPKAINSALHGMSKQYGNDWKGVRNAASIFTYIVKRRARRKQKIINYFYKQ